MLFNIMDKIINEGMCYADDAVLVLEKEDNLQGLFYRFEQKAKRLTMEMSVKKQNVFAVSRELKRMQTRGL